MYRIASTRCIPKRHAQLKRFLTVEEKKQLPFETSLYGSSLLQDPNLNKGAAFTREERQEFELEGLLPYQVHSLETQITRAYAQLDELPSDLLKYTFLQSLREQNLVLFFALLQRNLFVVQITLHRL